MSKKLERVRNIGVMAHIDAGKTTFTERVLYYTGKTYKMGEVHEGTAVMDFMEEEQERGITITSASTNCPWKDWEMNLIDTPGHVDFTAEVERSLRILDGAVAVFDASEGVQAQSETVWRQGEKYNLPCICFVNKMDKIGADFEMCVDSIRDKLLANPVILQIPIGASDDFHGLIDLIKMKAVHYKTDKLGASYEEKEIPEDLRDEAEIHRHDLLDAIAEYDEELMELYIHDEHVSEKLIHRALRAATIQNKVNPVFVGSALKYIGIQRMLDGIGRYLPSPVDRPAILGHKPNDKDSEIEVVCDAKKPLVALAFKITSDKHGDLYFLRIYQGTLKSGSRILNGNSGKKENVTRLFQMHAASRDLLETAQAGDIIACIGLKDTMTGDTLCDTKHPVVMENITFPETVISMSIEPYTAAERDKLGEALGKLRKEDPTFKCKYDNETGQTIISGMGELHLEILQHRLIRDMKVNVRVGKPRVAYREAITKTIEQETKFVKQSGGRGQYGHVVVIIEPLQDENGNWLKEIEFENKIVGGSVPKEYIRPVEKGVKEGFTSGQLAGYPVVGAKVTLIDGSSHAVDSSEMAFEQAGVMAIREGLKKAGSVLLEPIMKIQIVVPEADFGAVQGNLISKRGTVTDTHMHGNMRVIEGRAPLAELFGYSGELRGATGGRGSFVMEPSNYEKVPEQISEKILAGA